MSSSQELVVSSRELNFAGTKLFTLEEANRSLVLVKKIVRSIVGEYPVLVEQEERIEFCKTNGLHENLFAARFQLVDAVDMLQGLLGELDHIGVWLRDFTTGTVDFPCVLNDRPACFCWTYGQNNIQYWYYTDESCCERKPVCKGGDE